MTWEEFRQQRMVEISCYDMNKYAKIDITCPECGQPVYKDTSIIFILSLQKNQKSCPKICKTQNVHRIFASLLSLFCHVTLWSF